MRKKHPPECKRHVVTDLNVWELLEREGLLDRVYKEVWLWYTLPPKLRRRRERERAALEATRIVGYTPPRTRRRGQPDPWLYLTSRRGVHYRLHGDGTVQVWKRNPPLRGIGGGGWGWYGAASHRIHWLWAISSALMARQLRAEIATEAATQEASVSPPARHATPDAQSNCPAPFDAYAQLPLFDG